ncbi:uncharacterized protein LOC128036202 [Gossypium raimondii]|uniref:uncharacterized protein LOC128036202 n=1 Tax=Gossypium raimondii TaxID=29730 RepID=UPI00227C47C8|nr:uncharacterized protein LOC128036202 [Gossypium raimondii]
MSMDTTKIDCISSWPTHRSVKELRSFLGLTGYYRRFIRNYGEISRLLTDLLQKNCWGWNDRATEAFQALKQALVTAPVLVLPNFQLEFTVDTDASGGGIGAVLQQQGRPIAFFSKALRVRHQALSIYEKEMLTVLLAVRKWHAYLVQQSYTQDDRLQQIIQRTHQHPNPDQKYSWDGRFLFRKGKIVVGKDSQLRRELFFHFHASAIGGHSGVHVTRKRLSSQLYWKGLTTDVKRWIRECITCQKCKEESVASPGLLQPLPIPDRAWKSGTRLLLLTAYHPQTDGQTELTPYEALYGQPPPAHMPYLAGISHVAVVDRSLRAREAARKLLHFCLKKAQHRMKHFADKHRSERSFQQSLGKVSNQKLSPKYYGPFPVIQKVGAVAYTLQLPQNSHIHPTFHVSQLKKHVGSTPTQLQLPLVDAHGALPKEPVRISDRRIVKKGSQAVTEVLVEWADSFPEDATWESFSALQAKFPHFQP